MVLPVWIGVVVGLVAIGLLFMVFAVPHILHHQRVIAVLPHGSHVPIDIQARVLQHVWP